MVIYPVYYRRFGIRKPEQMLKPPLPRLEMLELPRESIFHYPGVGPLDDGPIETDIIFNNNKRPIYIEHVTDLGDVQGNPRRMSVDIQRSMRMYRMKNPRFRPSRDLETSTRDPQTLLVYNYSYIHRMYKYMRTYFSNYHRWSNLNASVWKTIGKVSEQTNRHHFIEVQLPKILPSFTALKVGETVMNQKTVKIFDSAESLTLLEIWKWLGVNRKSSSLSFVKPENYSKVNFIFRESGRWFVLNMGVLDSWRIPTKTEIAEGATENKGFHTEQIQKRFLRLMISLFEARTNGDLPENLGEENESQKAIDSALTNSKSQVSSNSPSSTGVDSINSTAATVSNPVSKKTDNTGNANASGASVPEEEQVLDDEGDDDAVQVTDASDLTAVELNEVDVYSQDLENQIDADLEKLEDMGENTQNDQVQTDVIDNGTPGVKIATAKVKTLESAIIEHCNRLADAGGLSAAEYRRYIEMAGTYKTIKAPNGETLDTFIQVPKELTEIKDEPAIPDQKTIVDKTMLKSSLLQFDKNYVTNVLHRDVAAMVTNMQNAGVIITDYSVEEIEDITGSHTVHEIKIKPLQGSASTLHFKLPKVDEEGNFKVNGVNYRMRKQRGDLPIRKISPSRVALTTYYGKIFVDRSERRANNYGRWLTNSIMSIGMEAENDIVTQLIPGNCFNSDVKLPRLYTILAQSFKGFNLKIVNQGKAVSWRMGFDYNKRQELLGEVAVDTFEDDDNVVCGVNASGNVMVMSKTGVLYRVEQTPAGNTLVAQPPIEDILGISSAKMPLDFAELKIFGKAIPVAVVLCYLQGLETVVKNLGITPRIVPAGTRVQQTPDEWVIPFQDETWVFSREHELANMVLGGWRELKDTTLSYSSHEFSKPDVYLNVLEDYGLGVRYLREFDLLSQMFVDPISKELLLEMGEPTDFEGLMRRSSELLMIDQHPNELDSAYMRIKGYERFAGAVYAELVRSIRIHNARPGKSRYPIELNPYAVWIQINQDPAKNQVVEINPIQNLKEAEAVTYSGTGGRSSRSMVKRTRVYHPNDMGTISESTVDNSDVAINTYLSADPQFKNLRGISKRYKVGETGPTALLSTSGLLSVGATVDDPKRVNFIAIQHGHGVACNGYHQNAVRTGYEQVIPHRTGDMFCVNAKQDGKVISVNDVGIIVEYADGTRIGVKLGTIYGNAAGLVIPHSIVTRLKAGQEFKKGANIAYNDGFFEPDFLNPNQVIWKSAVNARTVLLESADTLEDSSAISKRLASKLITKITKVRTIVVNFDQKVHRIVKPGDSVETESILCVIEDAIGGDSSPLDDETLDTLRVLSAQSPQSKVQGKIDRVEIYYHGDKEDMSDSLRQLADVSDAQIARRNKSIGKKAFTGSVDENFRIENEALALDTAAIQVYITSEVPSGVGDKGVFGNQMKTVFGRVFGDGVKTASGKPIDAIFGAKSIDDRIVMSPIVIGTTTTILDVIGQKAVKAYRS